MILKHLSVTSMQKKRRNQEGANRILKNNLLTRHSSSSIPQFLPLYSVVLCTLSHYKEQFFLTFLIPSVSIFKANIASVVLFLDMKPFCCSHI